MTVELTHFKRETNPLTHLHESIALKQADQAFLHKKHQDNILISEIAKLPGENYRAYALPLPSQHFFQDGACDWFSPIYLLEIARQGMMQVSHSALNIPLSTPMNLFSIKLNIDAPIARNVPLKLDLKKESFFELNNSLIAKITTTFSDKNDVIFGSILIGAQVINKEHYNQIRNQ